MVAISGKRTNTGHVSLGAEVLGHTLQPFRTVTGVACVGVVPQFTYRDGAPRCIPESAQVILPVRPTWPSLLIVFSFAFKDWVKDLLERE
jgi:hypothetical protein